jgi:hypothetical protein
MPLSHTSLRFSCITNVDLQLYLAAFHHRSHPSGTPSYFADLLHLLAQAQVSHLSLVQISHSLASLCPLLLKLQSCLASQSNLLRLLWCESQISISSIICFNICYGVNITAVLSANQCSSACWSNTFISLSTRQYAHTNILPFSLLDITAKYPWIKSNQTHCKLDS